MKLKLTRAQKRVLEQIRQHPGITSWEVVWNLHMTATNAETHVSWVMERLERKGYITSDNRVKETK